MKRLLAIVVLSGMGFAAQAADDAKPERKRPEVTEEQKKARKEIVDKYDANKDGKLDAAERKGMSAEDKEKLAKISGRGADRKKPEEAK